ncbi:MAG: tetratricopeptide repeat protein, partial [Planctomycetota bacterium]
LKIVAAGPRALLAELGELCVAPDGQLMLDFGRTASSAPPDPVPFAPPSETRSADELFEHALACEGDERLAEAEKAYRAALALRPHFPEAQFNLANVLRAQERPDAAEERYRSALDQAPDMAEAWYNLADLLEEADRLVEAIDCLRSALAARPDYADAHFNLACCCEQAGRSGEAADHWRAYLSLDPESEWADMARTRLGG